MVAQVLVVGKIKDSNNQPIATANVLAIPHDKSVKMMFTSSDDDGNYQLNLVKDQTYKLTFSHISFINLDKEFKVSETKEVLNITLQDNVNALQEIVITDQAPITIKKDTTTYKVNAFTNGKERKLREVLKKLPGLEVDKEGAVTIQGKKVTRLFVEGKEFFNGDTKLGVNNIPADVVSEIEVIEDYHDTAFLKGLESSDDIIMNVKLLEDKKKFVFGDIEVGAGVENRYKIHPKIFKYAPKLTLNIIGDLNNTFEKSFTLKDYINFQGGFDFKNSSELFDSNIVNLLLNNDYISNTHQFIGFNAHYNPNDTNEIRTFVIGLNDNSDYKILNTINYLNQNIEEELAQSKNNETSLLLSKLTHNYMPDENTVLKSELTIEKNRINGFENNVSSFFGSTTVFNKTMQADIAKLKTDIGFDKKFSKNHVSIIDFKIRYNNNNDQTDYNSDDNIFSDEIPLVMDATYNINQQEDNDDFGLDFLLKHYWVINRKNHLYFSIQNNYTDNSFISNDFQRLSTNEANDFEGFNNDLQSQYNYFNNQIEYKRIFNSVIAEVRVRYENHKLINAQDGTDNTISNSKVIPEFKITWDINAKKELNFNYTSHYKYPSISNYATGQIIRGFYSIFKGNENLDLIKSQNFKLNYSYRKMYGFSFSSYLSYRKNSNIIINDYLLSEVYTSINPLQFNKNNNSYTARLRFSYNKPYWRLKYGARYVYASIFNLIDDSLSKAKRENFSNDLDFTTKFEDNPNLEINANYTISNNENDILKNNQKRFSVSSEISYDYKDWKFNTNYTFTNFINKASYTTISFFDDLGASIFYNKEDSLWSFEIKAHNLTNNKSNRFTNFNTTYVNEDEIFVFPRYIMLNIIYKI